MPRREDDDASQPLVWRSLPLRLAIIAIPLWLTTSILIFNVGWQTKLLIAIVLGVSLVAPARGLLLAAACAPLGHLIAGFVGPGNFRIGEAVIVAFLTGWLVRALPDRRGPRVPFATAGWLFGVTVVASVAALAWQLRAFPGQLPAVTGQLVHAYYLSLGDPMGVVDAAHLLEGLAVASATVMLFRRRPTLANTLPAVLAASASVAAVASVLEWHRAGGYGYRISVHVADVNAAGSYFAMIVCVSIGMTLHARGYRRIAWAAAVAAAATGLWFSESRTSLVAMGLVLLVTATWYVVARWKPAMRIAAIATMLAIGIGGAALRIHKFNFGVDYRQQFYETSARMLASRPLFGIGVGRYYGTSPMFLSPQLAWNYGLENAHNNFLQIAGELGLVGLGLFLVWIGAGIVRALRAVALVPRDTRLLGLTAGVMTFVATWTGSHPLLVGEVALPFWMAFGLMAALAGSTILNHATGQTTGPASDDRAWWRKPAVIAAAAAAIVAATIGTQSRLATLPGTRDVDGFYDWESGSDGVRFRWSEKFASLFVPADTTRVEIPVRVPAELRLQPPLEVDLMVGGAFQSRATVIDSWTTLVVMPPAVKPPARFKRIDLRVDRTWQPGIYIPGSADMRTVGIQVGAPRLFH